MGLLVASTAVFSMIKAFSVANTPLVRLEISFPTVRDPYRPRAQTFFSKIPAMLLTNVATF